jgi:hypothetical protein
LASRHELKLLAVSRALPLLAAIGFSGCAPVGPNFERPAAIVSPQFKRDQGLEDRHAARERAERRVVVGILLYGS